MGRTFSMVLVGTRFKVPIPRRTTAAGRAAMPYAERGGAMPQYGRHMSVKAVRRNLVKT